MKNLLKSGRENKELTTRQVATFTEIDQALISKFENGYRTPTKKQIAILADVLDINVNTLTTAWYKKKFLTSLDFDTNAIQAITEILVEKGIKIAKDDEKESKIASILDEIENLKNKLSSL